jgi:hypothetical protein
MKRIARAFVGTCFLALSTGAVAGWEYHKDSDPFSDVDRSIVLATDKSYKSQDDLGIGFKCMEDGLNLLLIHKFLGGDSDDEVRVQMRVDKKEPYGPKYWKLFPGGKATWMPLGEVQRMVNEMREGTRLQIRIVDPLDGETLNQSVSLWGFSAAIEKLPCYAR